MERDTVYWYFWKYFGNTCFVADDNGIVGVVLGHLDQRDGTRAYMNSLAVKKERRNQGIGTALIKQFDDACKSLGVKVVEMQSQPENDRARRLYLRLGFEQHGEVNKLGRIRIMLQKNLS